MSEISETKRDSLHSAIMSIPVEAHQATNRDYKIGHRAALHAAAELAAEFMSPPRMNGCRIGSHVPHRRAAMSELTDQRLDEIEAIANTATPGPLEVAEGDLYDSEGTDRWSVVKDVGGAKYFVATVENGCPGDTLETEKANAELFALSRTAIPEMVAELKQFRMESAEEDQRLAVHWDSDMRAIRMWQEENPGNDLTWPSNDRLCFWLMQQMDRLKASSPSWQDRPTGPGLWVCMSKPWHDGKMSDVVLMLSQEDIDRGEPFNVSRVFGPIPADESKPTEGTEPK